MTTQVFGSIYVGLVVSAVLFLPLLVWQYRRYGRFDGLRMMWTAAGFIYLTAIVAFTVFPLPDFAGDFCSVHRTTPLWDPLRFPRSFVEVIGTDGVVNTLTSSLVWEFTMNMVLFIPFGIIVRRVFEWPRPVVLAAALGTSLLIEATQLTGNWGIAPCSYRFADTTDLFTNSTGALIGIGLERLTPRLLSTKAYLLENRDRARPVTRGRRWAGMILNTWYLGLSAMIGGTVGSTVFALTSGVSGGAYTPAQYLDLQRSIFVWAWGVTMAVVLLPALTGTGASLGQRTVYLRSDTDSLARRLVRAAAVQGAIPTMMLLGFPTALVAPLWLSAAAGAVLLDPRGLSYRLSGCRLRDSRPGAARD